MAYATLTESCPRFAARHHPVQSDQEWKQLTDKANKAYSARQTSLAEALYRDALAKAEMLFNEKAQVESKEILPVIYNISCHNLAELFENKGMNLDAEHFYTKAYDRLLKTANEHSAALPLRISCMQHLKHSLSVLIHFLQSNGSDTEQMTRLVQQANHTAYRIYQIVQHSANCEQCQNERPAILS